MVTNVIVDNQHYSEYLQRHSPSGPFVQRVPLRQSKVLCRVIVSAKKKSLRQRYVAAVVFRDSRNPSRGAGSVGQPETGQAKQATRPRNKSYTRVSESLYNAIRAKALPTFTRCLQKTDKYNQLKPSGQNDHFSGISFPLS